MLSRREFLSLTSAAAAGVASLGATSGALAQQTGSSQRAARQRDGTQGRVITPNGVSLPWKEVDGVKVYHLVAEPIVHHFAEGLEADLWGYNGRSPGPTIEAIAGDRVRIYVSNRLPAPTTVHWHGIVPIPNGMDGVAGLNQAPIPPGETFKYEFDVEQPGTFMYHPHFDELTQMAMGMNGMLVVHPRGAEAVDRDFAIMLAEWHIPAGTRRPDPGEMVDFNLATMNSKVFPATEPLVAQAGDRVRIRLCNLSVMSHHPIHLHGHTFQITGTEGGHIPRSAQWPDSTVLVPLGGIRDVEFVAQNPGDWAMHCHMLHHLMNQMGHASPTTVGVDAEALDRAVQPVVPDYMTMGARGMADMVDMDMDMPENSIVMKGGDGPFGHIDMAGMFTIVKVREQLASYDDPGWYDHPPEAVARRASDEELRRDGIELPDAPEEPPVPDHEH
jgi:manganese oxidase